MTLKERIFNIKNQREFTELALEVFHLQVQTNHVYGRFVQHLRRDVKKIKNIDQIPFLPISFFKTHRISIHEHYDVVFSSSGTTGTKTSKHFVYDLNYYIESFTRGFKYFYGHPKDWAILALLPGYLERKGSSLVFMANALIKQSKQAESRFYLHDEQILYNTLLALEAKKQKTLLIGVSFALLDFTKSFKTKLKHTIVMETGGMKGRKVELPRDVLHDKLKKSFGIKTIHSEYGMTELLSQAYSSAEGLFRCPPWMQIRLRALEDPLEHSIQQGKIGALNVIDLANVHSCSFIATDDLTRLYPKKNFEILGRMDNSDVRGCNLFIG